MSTTTVKGPDNREILDLDSTSDDELNKEIQKLKERHERKAKMIAVLDRGIVGDRLFVPLPDDKYGEWVANDKLEIYRMEAMGFSIDTEYAKSRALHSDGTEGKSIVADAIFMVCDRENKEIIDEIRAENYKIANSPRGGRQKEERDFDSETASVGLPSQIKSRVEGTNVDQIRAALSAKD